MTGVGKPRPVKARFFDNAKMEEFARDIYAKLAVVEAEVGATGPQGPAGPGHTYVERWQVITPATIGSWQDVNLSGYGVSNGETCEIMLYDPATDPHLLGVREDGSALDRCFDVNYLATICVKAVGVNATIEVLVAVADNEVYLTGYWTAT